MIYNHLNSLPEDIGESRDFVSTVGIDEEKILKYVQWQGRQDSGQAKLEF